MHVYVYICAWVYIGDDHSLQGAEENGNQVLYFPPSPTPPALPLGWPRLASPAAFGRAQKAKVDSAKSPSSSASKVRPKAAAAATKARAKAGAKGKSVKGGGKGGAEAEAPVKRTRQPSKVMWRVSDELAAVVGSTEATVDTIRSGVHRYIKEHNLQVGWVGGVWDSGWGFGAGDWGAGCIHVRAWR